MMYEFHFYLVTMVRLPVDVCKGESNPDIFLLDIFVCIILETKSTEVKEIAVR